MQIFVWKGPEVLKNYSSGLAVVVAESVDDAWEKLKAADLMAYCQLQLGHWHTFFDSDTDLTSLDEDDLIPLPGFPIEPTAYTLDRLPVLIKHGGE